jgi:ABC-type glutathione transport system ATPase component
MGTQARGLARGGLARPDQVLHKYPHQLSGGQLQRLLIARALLLDIEFLVADEIISMLDASTRIDVLNLLADLKARGLGILFITHDLSLGNYISERTVILRRGVIVEMGATAKVFGNPQHPYTRMLLASVPQLHREQDVLCVRGPAPGRGAEHAHVPGLPGPAGHAPHDQPAGGGARPGDRGRDRGELRPPPRAGIARTTSTPTSRRATRSASTTSRLRPTAR